MGGALRMPRRTVLAATAPADRGRAHLSGRGAPWAPLARSGILVHRAAVAAYSCAGLGCGGECVRPGCFTIDARLQHQIDGRGRPDPGVMHPWERRTPVQNDG